MICTHFKKIKDRTTEFIPKGICEVDETECINPFMSCVIMEETKNKHLFNFVT